MPKGHNLKDLTPEKFENLMENDPDFRAEMLRRQAAAVDKIAADRKARKEKMTMAYAHHKIDISPVLTDEIVFNGGGCSTRFIKTAPILELQKAVKEGRLSAIRYKIEIKRRRNRNYYGSIPDRIYDISNIS